MTRPLPGSRSRNNFKLIAALAGAAIISFSAPSAYAQSFWNVATSSSWNTAGNWNPSGVPNATGAAVIFNGAATGSNVAATGNRTINLDGAQTIGAATFNNNNSTFSHTIANGTGGSLTFDAAGAGPATINLPDVTGSGGTGNNTVSASLTLTDSLTVNVDNISASSSAGAITFTGTMVGGGGFTKNGLGLATLASPAKAYTGATVFNGGRVRISVAGQPNATSSVTVNAGGQIDFITAGAISMGSGPVNLNGNGPTAGPFNFAGAIRPDTNLAISLANATVLQSDSTVHIQGSSGGIFTFTNTISGVGKFTAGGAVHDANIGKIIFNGLNTYQGGTLVNCGTLEVSGTTATLGTGDVTVVSANAVFGGSSARLQIDSGVANAIDDSKALYLAGGGAVGVADDGYVNLGTGVVEQVNNLYLGGVWQTGFLQTFGATGSGATNINDEYFSGPGVISLVPEPAALSLLALGAAGLLRRERRRV